jgi:hypothetical protein
MREVPQIEISPNELVYAPLDPFARSIPRQSRMPFNLGRSDPVEEIDEERGWLWGTQTSKKKGTDRLVTPGLGVGKYRSKNSRGQRQDSLNSRRSHLQTDDIDELMEELMYADEAGGAYKYDHEPEEPSTRFTTTGVSSLLGRLKDSFSDKSGFGSLSSSAGRLGIDSSRGRWNEVGRLVIDDEKDITTQDEDDHEKTPGFQVRFESNVSFRSAPPLSQTVLPVSELSASTRDDHSDHKVVNRARAPSLEVKIDDAQAEHFSTSHPFRQPDSCPRTSGTNSVRQLVNRLEENDGKFTHLPSPSSRQPRRKRKEALSSRDDTRPDQYTHAPQSRTEKIGGLVKVKSKHLYPGGYVGRSPTKKLRKKESPDA